MLKSHIKIALRNIARNKIHAAISISGLAIGVACCFLIMLHLQNECSYDRFHAKHNRIYRLYETNSDPGGHQWTRSLTGTAPGWRMEREFPEIETFVRFLNPRIIVGNGEKKAYEDRVFYVDSTIFDVFSFKLTSGDCTSALMQPYSVVLTESMAQKYFGKDDPVGQTLTFENQTQMTVTGVLKNIPKNSHLKFDFLVSLSTMLINNPGMNDAWSSATRTYFLLSEGADPVRLEEKFPAFVDKYLDKEKAASLDYGLQALDDVHLFPTGVDLEATTSKDQLYMFGAIAVFILIIAILNFVNLSTALYARRVNEVAVRKVLGATRKQLRWQFISESSLLVLVSVILSVPIAELFLPTFNALVQGNFIIDYFGNPAVILGLIGFVALVGLVGGSYPAIILSRHNPTAIFRRSLTSGKKGTTLRRVLVISQFAISVGLILSAIVMRSQFNFLVAKDLGFESRNIMVIPVTKRDSLRGVTQTLKSELLKQPHVASVTASSNYPADGSAYGFDIRMSGSPKKCPFIKIYADEDYLSTLGLHLTQGRNFSTERVNNLGRTLVINESAARYYGDGVALGETVHVFNYGSDFDAEIIGVVDNFHFRDLTYGLQPAAILVDPSRAEYLLVRIAGDNIPQVITSVRETFSKVVTNRPFEYSFLDDRIRQVYDHEQRFASLFGYSCLLAVFIALIGLFGLALHATQQRTKEIGIRKVCGASSHRIVAMLTVEFVILVVAANIVALPAAYSFLRDWLVRYPYRIEWGISYFVSAIATSLLLALLTVGYQSLKSASANPVDALKYE